MITLDRVEVTVPSAEGVTTILHPTSLELGEPRIALIGANGSGKSTLARLCNGLVRAATGTVTLRAGTGGSIDAGREGAAARRRVGFIFSDPRAQLVMPTVAEDVALSLRREHRRKADRAAAATAVLERYGIADLAEQSVHTLSGGQQQLLAIASVLATNPDIVVADEPTTLLDLRNSRIISDLLMSLAQQVIVATHDLDLAARCDRVIVLDRGCVVFDDEPAAAIEFYRAQR